MIVEVDRRLEPVRLDDQQVAGQVLECSFGRRADEQAFPAVSRDRAHDDDIGIEFVRDQRQLFMGEAGNNAQHSFYQLLHQGTRLVPVDFILPAKSSGADQAQQDLAIDNCLAQAEALMDGFDEEGLEPYRVHKGNSPSNTILFAELTPEVLGQLIALYEHKVFVEGVIWGIDSFDQWGVELGKRLAEKPTSKNSSTLALRKRISDFRSQK